MSIDSREADVVLLDDTRVQTVEVHDQNETVIETFLRLEDETTLVLVLLFLVNRLIVVSVVHHLFFGFLQTGGVLVGADVFVAVEFVKQNVLVAFSTSTTESTCP